MIQMSDLLTLLQTIITPLLALYGAFLSTILAIMELQKIKRKVEVRCGYSLSKNPSTGEVDHFLMITAVNKGYRQVQIDNAGFVLSDGRQIFQMVSRMGNIPLPKILADGQSINVFFDVLQLKQSLREAEVKDLNTVSAFVRDAEGRTYRTRISPRFSLE